MLLLLMAPAHQLFAYPAGERSKLGAVVGQGLTDRYLLLLQLGVARGFGVGDQLERRRVGLRQLALIWLGESELDPARRGAR